MWNAMVAADEHGVTRAIKDNIAQGLEEGGAGPDKWPVRPGVKRS
ncbi:hypothetical protein [Streptosporangium saharense]|uniref:Uncharacterized protein n=1 Tax=Streptosporangium saharense TaxID=1706840 RepID=A0A7W7QGH5_9ACTN|nr:hypothetical protein [Streptosporangium saharense]MBB4912934.1 hypothetical protein [Streptosporangium saharense]